jgi:hypothetical protein
MASPSFGGQRLNLPHCQTWRARRARSFQFLTKPALTDIRRTGKCSNSIAQFRKYGAALYRAADQLLERMIELSLYAEEKLKSS